jgi:urease accessory protein
MLRCLPPVHSRVEIVADVADDGRTVLARLKARGQYAARCTAPGTVYLVGTAAGPLGGDLLDVSVLVRSGARLAVAGVAATLALPGRSGSWAESSVELEVEDGARLDQAMPPLVVCHRARLRTTTRLSLAGSAAVELIEQVVFGRHSEPGGDWIGRTVVDRDGTPVLRATQRSAVLRAAPQGSGEVRALVSRLIVEPGISPDARTSGNAVTCPLAAGGVLMTAIGPSLTAALADSTLPTGPAVIMQSGDIQGDIQPVKLGLHDRSESHDHAGGEGWASRARWGSTT